MVIPKNWVCKPGDMLVKARGLQKEGKDERKGKKIRKERSGGQGGLAGLAVRRAGDAGTASPRSFPRAAAAAPERPGTVPYFPRTSKGHPPQECCRPSGTEIIHVHKIPARRPEGWRTEPPCPCGTVSPKAPVLTFPFPKEFSFRRSWCCFVSSFGLNVEEIPDNLTRGSWPLIQVGYIIC